jgi:pyocin large subunit-like protein
MASLQDHFDRHGADFKATSPDDYAAKAWIFREQAVAQKLPMKLDGATVRVMNLRTLAFGAYNRDGTTKTYFRPRDASYWDRQPGEPITTPPWVR